MRTPLLAGASLSILIAAGSAAAQTSPSAAAPDSQGAGTLSEIVVTATKRSERLIDVPASVTALQGQTLQNLGAQTVADFAALTPGLQFTSSGAGSGNELVLRGIAVNGLQPSSLVGVVVDGSPVGSSSSYANGGTAALDSALWDVARVEVLRGPQGTLYGANSMGGLLSYVYNRPDLSRFSGKVEAEGSETEHGDGSWAVRGMVNLPIAADKAALRVSAFHDDGGGFIDNPTRGEQNIDYSLITGARADLRLDPTDRLSIDLVGAYQHSSREASDEATYVQATSRPVAGPLDQLAKLPDPFSNDFREVLLNVDYDLGPVRLTSTTSYQRYVNDITIYYSDNLTGFVLEDPALLGLPVAPSDSVDAQINARLNKFTQELRLTSKGAGPLKYLAGFFYTHEDGQQEQLINGFAADGAPTPGASPALDSLLPSTFEEYAFFGQLSYTLMQRLELTAGIRYSHDLQSFSDTSTGVLSPLVPNVPFSQSTAQEETYLFTARYALSSDSSLYARAASGYRPGGPNVVISGAPPTYASDSLWNYEAGYKARLFGGLAEFSADAFYIQWKGIQALTAVNGFSTIINGGEASSRGAEAELVVRPVSGLTLGANVAYTDAHLDQDSSLIGGLAGDPLPYSAKWSGAVYGDYDFPLTGDWRGFVGATLRAVDRRNSGFPQGAAAGVPNYVLPSYMNLDLRAGVDTDRYRLTLFVDNVADEREQISALTQFETLTGQAEVTMARPRTVGLRLDASF